MRITIATLIAFFTMNIVCAQTDTFMVKSLSTTVTVVPNDSWFHVREDYPVKITFKSKNKMSRVELKGGTATKKDSLWVLRAEAGGEAVLVVYEKLPNGKEQVALSKSYKLFGRELPEVTVDFVKNDSVADKLALIALGKLRAKTKYGQQVFRVDSFCMYIRNPKGGMDTLWSKTGQMTLEMKQRVDAIDVKKSGGMLMYDEIHATSPEGKDVELPPLRVFLSPESRMRFGL
jgi:hypothetical protein